jgi:hypothetical protein
MTNQPNIQKQILEFVLAEVDEPCSPVDLPEFADTHGYDLGRVMMKANETGVLTCGTTMKYPWYNDRSAVEDKLDEWES